VSARRRLDHELVRRGLATSRTKAGELVAAGRVTVAGAPADKPARLVDAAEPVEVLGPDARYVSRGGHKLEGALHAWSIDLDGRSVLDAGASTGGFTDCLLQHGAERVVAVDVGHGQLHPRIRQDPRVEVHERTNLRGANGGRLGPVDLVVADLSFISLTLVIDTLLAAVRPGGDLLLLVKPQFEVGRRDASRARGVITDPALHQQALGRVLSALEQRGASIIDTMTSPLPGTSGNVEFFVWARRQRTGGR
jgi:23S rRNA (cytidine1920-2'-O)/16S rRNA (cytidine1409-2'-O)-methyltransferase